MIFNTIPWGTHSRIYKRRCHTFNANNNCTVQLSSSLLDETSEMFYLDLETSKRNLYVAIGGFHEDYKVLRSPNGPTGQWSNITYNLPNFPILDLLYDVERRQLYAGTDIGVYVLENDTEEWKRLGGPSSFYGYRNAPASYTRRTLYFNLW